VRQRTAVIILAARAVLRTFIIPRRDAAASTTNAISTGLCSQCDAVGVSQTEYDGGNDGSV
jgi:hypothetical protein